MKKKLAISKDTLLLTAGVAVCLFALVILCSSAEKSIFHFLSTGVLAAFGFVGFWILVPSIFIVGIYLILRQKLLKFKVDVSIWGIYLLILGLLILFSIIGPKGQLLDSAEDISQKVTINPYHMGDGEVYIEFNTAVHYFSAIVEDCGYNSGFPQLGGGYLGFILLGALNSMLTPIGATVVTWIIIIVGVCLLFHNQLKKLFRFIKNKGTRESVRKDIYEDTYQSNEPVIENRVIYTDNSHESKPQMIEEMSEKEIAELNARNFNATHSLESPKLSFDNDDPFMNPFQSQQVQSGLHAPIDPFFGAPAFEPEQLKEEDPFAQSTLVEPSKPVEQVIPQPVISQQVKQEPVVDRISPAVAPQPVVRPTPVVYQEPVTPKYEEVYQEPVFEEEPVIEEEPKQEIKPVASCPRTSDEYRLMPQPKAVERPPFVKPSIDLINYYENAADYEANIAINDERLGQINTIFRQMKVGAEAVSYQIGPSVTRFDIKTDEAVSSAAVKKIQEDLSIRLGGVKVRYQAVVFGKMTSGLEIENGKHITVGLRECIEKLEENNGHRLSIPFGTNLTGDRCFGRLHKFPHMLVAGTTGSGKSYFIHGMISTLIMRNSPEDLKLVLIDPKKVEMEYYYEIPHLLCPNISDAEKACCALNKLVDEMERRLNVFQSVHVRDIDGFNSKLDVHGLEKMPQIVVFIDEYADLFMECKDIREPVCRLGQKARAVGISLVIATQRPSVDVIDGVVKSNLMTRVALTVATATDSSVVLDETGAETLLGNGDMIVSCPSEFRSNKPRIQGCYFDPDIDITNICDYLRANYKPEYHPYFMDLEGNGHAFKDEPEVQLDVAELKKQNDEQFYESVKEAVMMMDYCSMSWMTRTFGIGFPKAGRIFNKLIKEGIVSADTEASKGSKVLVHNEAHQEPLKQTEYLDETFSIESENNNSYQQQPQEFVEEPENLDYGDAYSENEEQYPSESDNQNEELSNTEDYLKDDYNDF